MMESITKGKYSGSHHINKKSALKWSEARLKRGVLDKQFNTGMKWCSLKEVEKIATFGQMKGCVLSVQGKTDP